MIKFIIVAGIIGFALAHFVGAWALQFYLIAVGALIALWVLFLVVTPLRVFVSGALFMLADAIRGTRKTP